MNNTHKKWNITDENQLKELVGLHPIPKIAAKLNRNNGAIERKIEKLRICTKESRGDITAYSLASILNVDTHTVLRWIENHGLPHTRRITKYKRKNIFIQPEDFWKWAEKNQTRINFSKIPKLALLPEPSWVDAARNNDNEMIPSRYQQYWTPLEDSVLLSMSAKGILQKEIAKALNRPARGVQKRLAFLRQMRDISKEPDKNIKRISKKQ